MEDYTKESFKEHIEALRTLKNSKGALNDYGKGRLALAEQVENLILFGVVRQSEQLKDKETPTFEVWLKDTYIKVNDSKYVHRKYKFEKDGHQVRNIYKILKDNL